MNEQTVIAKIAALKTSSTEELKALWNKLYGTQPPSCYRQYLEPRLAYRIQELAFGGITQESKKRLAEASKDKKMRLDSDRLTEGTVLVREWQNVQHRVRVLDDGFDYNGQQFRSLSAIARTITGVNWNGPLFFGLRSQARRV